MEHTTTTQAETTLLSRGAAMSAGDLSLAGALSSAACWKRVREIDARR